MKRRDLIKKLEANNWYFLRHGQDHDVYTNGTDIEPIPRHREIEERLAKAIIKRRGLK
ncbi:MAG: type II toxin-antitoxin system HicA family toxin [Clostridiales bacterium]|nr:type II toxin-antitoxin system HicA family toxin [Clostridiales bacterium]